ncbi:MAG: hypothetical protein A2079_00110 [Geobacteraceae bacterium GWC2_48_7]|nr:MAG: hypothetical protein A2079_00110 [Geobacteraceae bacterium GWC2_48_7]
MNKFVTNSIDMVSDQYHHLVNKFLTTNDNGEKKILLRRLANLVTVMEFLYTSQHLSAKADNFI